MVIGGVTAVRKYISLTEEITFQVKKKIKRQNNKTIWQEK